MHFHEEMFIEITLIQLLLCEYAPLFSCCFMSAGLQALVLSQMTSVKGLRSHPALVLRMPQLPAKK